MEYTTHQASQSWTFRPPSPPRLMVPPPDLDHKQPLSLHIINDDIDFDPNGFGNRDFLKTVTYDDSSIGQNTYNWRYEQRWTGQKILPFLFLGPIAAARSRDFLLQNGITMLLAVRNTKSALARLLGSKTAHDLNLPYATVDTAGNQELIAAFPRGIEMINTHLSEIHQQSQCRPTTDKGSAPGRVLVFCESGNERSAAMVVAYIMATYSVDVINAIQFVQARRFAIAFDDPTRLLLQTYDSILSAKRDVLRSMGHGIRNSNGQSLTAPWPALADQGSLSKCRKRTLDDIDDEMDMDEGGVSEERRDGVAPFRDNHGLG
ncbi:MAG: hypothetical protein Q9219_006838 [cf. Caloplaca sp. 3 TL-2023]